MFDKAQASKNAMEDEPYARDGYRIKSIRRTY